MEILLVHGGWQGGWAWDGVASRLRRAGHSVWSPTLLGSESDDQDKSKITLTTMAADLVDRVRERDTDGRLTIVGHSGGGPVAQLATVALGDRVERLIFVDAWVLRNGESVLDILPAENVDGVSALSALSADRSIRMPPELWATAFMQDGTEAQLADILPRLVAVPYGWLDDPITLPANWAASITTGYVFLEDDMGVPEAVYSNAAARLPDPIIERSPGSHQAIVTRPDEITQALTRILESK